MSAKKGASDCLTRMAIRQMLAAACSHETQVLQEKPQAPELQRTKASEDPLHAQAQL
jgi:hypothetical protein